MSAGSGSRYIALGMTCPRVTCPESDVSALVLRPFACARDPSVPMSDSILLALVCPFSPVSFSRCRPRALFFLLALGAITNSAAVDHGPSCCWSRAPISPAWRAFFFALQVSVRQWTCVSLPLSLPCLAGAYAACLRNAWASASVRRLHTHLPYSCAAGAIQQLEPLGLCRAPRELCFAQLARTLFALASFLIGIYIVDCIRASTFDSSCGNSVCRTRSSSSQLACVTSFDSIDHSLLVQLTFISFSAWMVLGVLPDATHRSIARAVPARLAVGPRRYHASRGCWMRASVLLSFSLLSRASLTDDGLPLRESLRDRGGYVPSWQAIVHTPRVPTSLSLSTRCFASLLGTYVPQRKTCLDPARVLSQPHSERLISVLTCAGGTRCAVGSSGTAIEGACACV